MTYTNVWPKEQGIFHKIRDFVVDNKSWVGIGVALFVLIIVVVSVTGKSEPQSDEKAAHHITSTGNLNKLGVQSKLWKSPRAKQMQRRLI